VKRGCPVVGAGQPVVREVREKPARRLALRLVLAGLQVVLVGALALQVGARVMLVSPLVGLRAVLVGARVVQVGAWVVLVVSRVCWPRWLRCADGRGRRGMRTGFPCSCSVF
jgi:hypothetical protein